MVGENSGFTGQIMKVVQIKGCQIFTASPRMLMMCTGLRRQKGVVYPCEHQVLSYPCQVSPQLCAEVLRCNMSMPSPGVTDDLPHCLLPGPVRVAVDRCQELLEGIFRLILHKDGPTTVTS